MQSKLILLRIENKVTQERLATLLKIDVSTYRKKENGLNEFKLTEMFIVASYFNKTLDEIFLNRNVTNRDKKPA